MIVPGATADDPAEFLPDVEGGKAGDPLPAEVSDLVSWNNTTDKIHRPWPTREDFTPLPNEDVLPRGSTFYLSDHIQPEKSSRPNWTVAKNPKVGGGKTMFYCCKLHPNERGKIIIT